jgi:hypothetical protein
MEVPRSFVDGMSRTIYGGGILGYFANVVEGNEPATKLVPNRIEQRISGHRSTVLARML